MRVVKLSEELHIVSRVTSKLLSLGDSGQIRSLGTQAIGGQLRVGVTARATGVAPVA
jgi:hypothetical protein